MEQRQAKRLARIGWPLVVLPLAGLFVATRELDAAPPVYTSAASVYVGVTRSPSDTGAVFGATQFIEQRARSFAQIASGEQFQRALRTSLGDDPMAKLPSVSVDFQPDTTLLSVTARDHDAAAARRAADTASTQLVQLAATLDRGIGSSTPPLNLVVVEKALEPIKPSGLSHQVLALLATLASIVIAIAVTVALARLDPPEPLTYDALDLREDRLRA